MICFSEPEICINVTDNEDIDLYCMAYNTMYLNPADGITVGPQPVQKNYVGAYRKIIVKGNRRKLPYCMFITVTSPYKSNPTVYLTYSQKVEILSLYKSIRSDFTTLKGTQFYILFVFTASGVTIYVTVTFISNESRV